MQSLSKQTNTLRPSRATCSQQGSGVPFDCQQSTPERAMVHKPWLVAASAVLTPSVIRRDVEESRTRSIMDGCTSRIRPSPSAVSYFTTLPRRVRGLSGRICARVVLPSGENIGTNRAGALRCHFGNIPTSSERLRTVRYPRCAAMSGATPDSLKSISSCFCERPCSELRLCWYNSLCLLELHVQGLGVGVRTSLAAQPDPFSYRLHLLAGLSPLGVEVRHQSR